MQKPITVTPMQPQASSGSTRYTGLKRVPVEVCISSKTGAWLAATCDPLADQGIDTAPSALSPARLNCCNRAWRCDGASSEAAGVRFAKELATWPSAAALNSDVFVAVDMALSQLCTRHASAFGATPATLPASSRCSAKAIWSSARGSTARLLRLESCDGSCPGSAPTAGRPPAAAPSARAWRPANCSCSPSSARRPGVCER
mmetsp:Transcript_101475/g.262317  ORF Transcript_101475/g.262317 Transcript_101475/m.262317 type:complete len:202 (-) Transcript_101475:203-808(-)